MIIVKWFLKKISRRIHDLENENATLRDRINTFLNIQEIHMSKKEFEMDFGGDFVPILAEMMYKFLLSSGGKSYVEIRLNPKNKEECGPLTLTLQRVCGKTPAELRKEADKRVETLEKELKELREKVFVK